VSWFGPQNQQLWFIDLDLKITAMFSWFGTQNQLGDDFSVAPQNRQEDEMAWGHASRSSGLLRVEASRARISQSGLKTGGGVTWMVYVTSSWGLHHDQVEDGRVDAMSYVGACYP
jgi:hypothetical protein